MAFVAQTHNKGKFSVSCASMGEEQGSGVDAFRVIRVNGDWFLYLWTKMPEEPTIRDVDLAEKLGYERPETIREVIDRLIKDEFFSNIYMRATVARISKPNGGIEERSVNEYWLTEEQACTVAAHGLPVDKEKIHMLLDAFGFARLLAQR